MGSRGMSPVPWYYHPSTTPPPPPAAHYAHQQYHGVLPFYPAAAATYGYVGTCSTRSSSWLAASAILNVCKATKSSRHGLRSRSARAHRLPRIPSFPRYARRLRGLSGARQRARPGTRRRAGEGTGGVGAHMRDSSGLEHANWHRRAQAGRGPDRAPRPASCLVVLARAHVPACTAAEKNT